MYLYFKKFTFQSFQIRQPFLDFSELRYSSGMRLYLYVQFRRTKVMGLVFVISFILVFFSPGIFYSLHAASLRRSLQHVEPPLPREGAAFAAIFASSSLIP